VYKINLPLIELPLDYRARVSLLTLILLARDLAERRYTLDNENRGIMNTAVINDMPLYNLIAHIYPVMLWGGAMDDAAFVASTISKKTFTNSIALPTPLLATGILAEDFMHRLANYLAEGKVTKGFRFATTGLGQAFMKFTAFIPRHSLSIGYYRTAIAAFAAISHAHYSVLDLAINEVLNTDIRGIVDNMLVEYSKHANGINAFNAYPDFYTQAYTRGEALRDLAAMVFALINTRLELLTKNQKLHEQLLRRYTFLMKPPNDLVKDAVKAILLASGLN
jgi:diacylglycerol kinase